MLSKIKRLFWRSFFYMRSGASVLGFAFTFLTFITVIYSNLSFLNFFGGYLQFTVFASGFVAVGLSLFGHWWLKRGMGFKQEVEVGVEANPYQHSKIAPNGVPFYEALVELCELHNVKCEEAKDILKRSGSKKYE